MTGELFNLLKEHSILADLLQGRSSPTTRSGAGVAARAGSTTVLPADLFSDPRRRPCSGRLRREGRASYASAAC